MNTTNKQLARSIISRTAPSDKIAVSLVTNLAATVLELLDKGEKLTKKELHELTRLRMLARSIKI